MNNICPDRLLEARIRIWEMELEPWQWLPGKWLHFKSGPRVRARIMASIRARAISIFKARAMTSVSVRAMANVRARAMASVRARAMARVRARLMARIIGVTTMSIVRAKARAMRSNNAHNINS